MEQAGAGACNINMGDPTRPFEQQKPQEWTIINTADAHRKVK